MELNLLFFFFFSKEFLRQYDDPNSLSWSHSSVV